MGKYDPNAPGPWGDENLHLPMETLEKGIGESRPPRDRGEVGLIVSRVEPGRRETPPRAHLTREAGVPGDAWQRREGRSTEDQITLMRLDVGRLIANGQDLGLFGDNLLVDLDLSEANLPTGSRLRVGAALLEVTAEPHTGCLKYRQRFGADALRLTAAPPHRAKRLRGIHARVVEDGEVAVGDAVDVVRRGPSA